MPDFNDVYDVVYDTLKSVQDKHSLQSSLASCTPDIWPTFICRHVLKACQPRRYKHV